MSEVNRIADQLRRAYDGPAWHGPALSEILSGVTEQTAARHPIPGSHSIWEIVLHITVWMSVGARRINGELLASLSPAEDWPAPPEPTEAAWRHTLDELVKAQRHLEAETRKLTDDRLREIVLGDIPHPIYTLLHGIVQHNLYHSGQITLLKKAAA